MGSSPTTGTSSSQASYRLRRVFYAPHQNSSRAHSAASRFRTGFASLDSGSGKKRRYPDESHLTRRSKVRFAPTFFYSCGTKNVIRPLPCSSFPNRTRCAGLRFGLRNENIRIGAPFQLRNFLFNTNPRLRRGFLVGQDVSSLLAVTRFAGLTAERWDDGGESVISLAASFYLSDMVV